MKVCGGGGGRVPKNLKNCHRINEIEIMLESIYLEFSILGYKVTSPHKEYRYIVTIRLSRKGYIQHFEKLLLRFNVGCVETFEDYTL